eukprot:4713750-Karenia_brevis.AAC.1
MEAAKLGPPVDLYTGLGPRTTNFERTPLPSHDSRAYVPATLKNGRHETGPPADFYTGPGPRTTSFEKTPLRIHRLASLSSGYLEAWN